MAIVFISPKQKQKTFFLGITALFLIVLVIIALFVFFAKPKDSQKEFVFNKPKISIDFNVFNSEAIKNFEPFPELEVEFLYEATTADKKKVKGSIWADSKEKATQKLEELKFFVSKIEEVGIGKKNPFQAY